MIKDFYIFRHGQSSYNVEGRTQGQTNDSVLTDLGKEQAISVGQRLRGKGVEIIVTSPLKRAMQTAELANQSLNIPIKTDNRFIEVDVGVVEGMHYTKIRDEYTDIFNKMHTVGTEFDDVCYPKGETRRQVRERIFNGLEDWANNSEYKTIAVSSHGIMLAQTLIALGESMSDIKNGAILHIRKDGDKWFIVEWI